jgi:GNAT superfamily N-acetyltransferase
MADAIVQVAVDVTFLKLSAPPRAAGPALPAGLQMVRVRRCAVPYYRFLYDTIGREWLWWMRRTQTDDQLGHLLAHPMVSIHVLYAGGQPAGFYELERRPAGVNISYFGLMPFAIGKGIGQAFLRSAVDTAWAMPEAKAITVNTCTADHPRAMATYRDAGFAPQRTVREVWRVPLALGLPVPERLRVS